MFIYLFRIELTLKVYKRFSVYKTRKRVQCLCFKMLSLSHNKTRTFRVDVGGPQMIECVRQNVTTGLENAYYTRV